MATGTGHTAGTHTPGPWHVWEADSSVVVGADNFRTATAHGGADHTFANARLIAAAPELLEVLKLICDQCLYPASKAQPQVTRAAIDQARAVLAKVTA